VWCLHGAERKARAAFTLSDYRKFVAEPGAIAGYQSGSFVGLAAGAPQMGAVAGMRRLEHAKTGRELTPGFVMKP
jgi:hypothetical protein